VAEDEAALARLIARVLTASGYDVVVVGDGTAAVDAVKDGPFDAILSDIQMPGASGVDVLRAAREHDLDVPVLLMTASPRVETAAQAVELGALQYLIKPFPPEVLCEAVERACQLHRMALVKREAMTLFGERGAQAGDRAGLMAAWERMLGTLWMAFQPIVDPGKKAVIAYEALLRSGEPALPHPGAILDAGERLDRLTELGRAIRARAAADFATAPPHALLFVNLHTRDLTDPELSSPEAPLSKIARRVVLEVTERAALETIRDVRARVAELRALGFRVAIDDLGAGYAGLTSFATLEPEFVKLDMSLVRGVDQSPIKQKLVASMSKLCRDMGMQVVAEGIETVEERDAILGLGCELLQGYLYAKPGRPFPEPSFA
jgi:EAL domain-containing protein (putative c-di-GMP-specific phosphodiesterase class I)/CheY-like chemotaxis protein